MKRILVLFPDADINTNSNLTGLVEILCERGCLVDIFCRRRPQHSQDAPCTGARVYLTDFADPSDTAILFPFGAPPSADLLAEFKSRYGGYDLVIGIDRGIIEAAFVAEAIAAPLGLISYEIYFAEETSRAFKEPEIVACRGLAFAVAQDALRARHLSIENRIPYEMILHIPVSGRGSVPRVRSYTLHDTLGIPRERKIALHMGSTEICMGIRELFESVRTWDPSWALVLHHRYGEDRITSHSKSYVGPRDNVYYSPLPPLSFSELGKLTDSADVGLAFYTPIFKSNSLVGLNVEHTGMASGKIAGYLQHDLPVVINEMGEMSEHVRNYALGWVTPDLAALGGVLQEIDRPALSRLAGNGHRFFRTHLDLDVTSRPLIDLITKLLGSS